MDILKDPVKVYNFPPHKRGDTVNQKVFNVTINDSPPIVPISDVKIELIKDNKIHYRYNVSNGRIVINDAGSFTMIKHRLDIQAGFYNYDIQITYRDGTVKTYIKGVWRIYEDYTK